MDSSESGKSPQLIETVRWHDYQQRLSGFPAKARIRKQVQPYTMTSAQRIDALIDAVRYVVERRIAGSFVECGVWRGGSMMTVALTLLALGIRTRELYLYDTFCGMSLPTSEDVSVRGTVASTRYASTLRADGSSTWCYADRKTVEQNIVTTGYPTTSIRYIEGPVEATLPSKAPERIALLRLDTDWYSSTRHALIHLFPKLEPFGILIVDDYGHWFGARRAIDEYLCKDVSGLETISQSARILIRGSERR